MGLTSGDWAIWATALSTAGACVAASIAASRAGRLLEIEQGRDRQSNKIAAWTEGRASSAEGFTFFGSPSYFQPQVVCVVANPTDQPIYGVLISWVHMYPDASDGTGLPSKVLGWAGRDLIPPRDNWEIPVPSEHLDALGESAELEDVNISETSARENAQIVAGMLRIGVSFNDSDGKRWTRLVDGRIVRDPKMDYPTIRS